MHSTMIESSRVKLSGLMKPWKDAKRPPATPPNVAPIAKASSLMLRVLMPIAAAASSSSRIATHARPMRESSRRREMKIEAMTHSEEHEIVGVHGRDRDAGNRVRLGEARPGDVQRVDQRDALRAVRDVVGTVQVVQKNADDLAEAERHDREIVAAQPQGGRAEQHSEHRGDECA